MKNNIFLTTIVTLSFIAFSLFLIREISFAQNVSIGVYPPIMQMDTTPPADAKADFFLTNPSDQSLELSISYKPFKPKGTKNGEIELSDDLSSFPDPLFVNRIKILEEEEPVKSVTLSPKQNKKLTLEVQLPPNEQKGDYYFTILFSARPTTNIKANSSLLYPTIGMNVLLTVGPKGKTEGYISRFSVPFFVDSGPVIFNVEVANRSNHFIQPTSEIVVKNLVTGKKDIVSLIPVNILANTVRAIPDSLQAEANSSEYEKIAEVIQRQDSPVAVYPKKFLLGFYNATLNVSLEENGTRFTKSVTFFAFPISFLLGIVLLLGIVIFIVLRVKKKIS